ncbi:recombinase family protein [Streptomyces hygroscopicus]|uniref:recombinase family protein n=1 Tax=Streptomyces hygroscopicus TaxID=1912 RepID=UPI00363F0C41
MDLGDGEGEARGNSLAHQQFQIPIPRDGSVADLLDEAQRLDCRFAAVICESIERVARRAYFGTKIEYELEQAGVALCAADEPIVTGPRAKRATPTLTRRVKQTISEWVRAADAGAVVGRLHRACLPGLECGQAALRLPCGESPSPVPARRAEGRTKHRLVPDASRAPAVTYIFQLRGLDKPGYDAIADRLNLDLVAYPPPEPTRPDMALRRWSGSAVREILRNPKYTGYQVWNRRATSKGGCYDDPKDWVWSPQPTHEPLVSKELFDVASTVARKRQVLRSYVICEICGRRMFGKNRHKISYYACQVDPNEHRDRPWFRDHPKSLWVREEFLITPVSRFFATHVFGPDRRTHLKAALEAARSADGSGDRTAKERAALEQAIKAIGERQARLIRTLADGGPDQEQEKEFRDAIRQEHATLGRQRTELAERLACLEAPKQAAHPADGAALLDAIPQTWILPASRRRSSGGSTTHSGWKSAIADPAKK